MSDQEVIKRALSMEPGRPGVGRLCQELLSEASGVPLPERHPSEPVVRCSFNQWGRKGEPQ
jgi:hypothetical protein